MNIDDVKIGTPYIIGSWDFLWVDSIERRRENNWSSRHVRKAIGRRVSIYDKVTAFHAEPGVAYRARDLGDPIRTEPGETIESLFDRRFAAYKRAEANHDAAADAREELTKLFDNIPGLRITGMGLKAELRGDPRDLLFLVKAFGGPAESIHEVLDDLEDHRSERDA